MKKASLLSSLLVNTIFLAPELVTPVRGQSYQPPVFTDAARLKNIEAIFPTIDKLYKEYAEKNHFPGFTYGLVVDGKLVHTGSLGYTDVDKKTPATTQGGLPGFGSNWRFLREYGIAGS